MFISCQSRECDLNDFFKHENQSSPASLSDNGRLHPSQKSQLAQILEDIVTLAEKQPVADVIIIDGSALVNFTYPKISKTFEEYATLEFVPQIEHTKRAVYQAGCIWGQATICNMKNESPGDWGWKKNGDMWMIISTKLPPIAVSCQQLTKCGCKTECHGRCKCFQLSLPCIALCSCNCDH